MILDAAFGQLLSAGSEAHLAICIYCADNDLD